MKRITAGVVLVVAVFLTGCSSNTDTVSKNLGKEAEKFNVQRKIVGINGITDKVLFEVEGRCSLENSGSLSGFLDVICKHGPSEYRTKFILRPERLVPDVDLVTGDTP